MCDPARTPPGKKARVNSGQMHQSMEETMLKHLKTLAGITAIFLATSPAHATSLLLPGMSPTQQPSVDHIQVADKFMPSKRLSIGPKGQEQIMSKAQLRSKNPEVYQLYRKTEKAALAYKANRGGGVPLSCSITETYLNCQGSTWFCTIWFDNLIASQCGPQPPSLPKS